MTLQTVNMRFDYREAFGAQRGTGYEVMLYACMTGDSTLFSRTDLVEAAWRVAQPILDVWSATTPTDFPSYPAGTLGPKAAYDLPKRDGREWVEVIPCDLLEKVPIFREGNPAFLQNLALALKPASYETGDEIITQGDTGREMYFLCRGAVEVLDGATKLSTLGAGDFFGELALLYATPRTSSVRAAAPCDLFVLSTADFVQVLKDHPSMAASIRQVARARYGSTVDLT